MADNKNDFYRADKNDDEYLREAADREYASDSPDGESASQMPPRNILETDSAKYTAEYIKEVVKGLYTVDTGAYSGDKVPLREQRGEHRVKPEYEIPRGLDESKGGDVNWQPARRASGQETVWNTDRNIKMPKERPERPSFFAQPERPQERQSESRAETYPSQKDEEPVQERFQKDDFKERYRKESHRKEDFKEDYRKEDFKEEYKREDYKRESYKKPEFREEFQKEDFMKSFEEKSRQDFVAPREPRKIFSRTRTDGNTAELESVLTGKPQKRFVSSAERNTERTSLRDFGEPPYSEMSAPKPQNPYVEPVRVSAAFTEADNGEEYVYIKAASDEPLVMEERITRAVPSNAGFEPEQEKIPLIINRNIEGKARKTAEDYNRTPSAGKPPSRRFEPAESRARGSNIIAAVFMIAAVVIIGVLVWKVTTLSNEAKAVQDNADAVARLENQIRTLSQQNSELEYELQQRDDEIASLRAANESLASASELNEPEQEAEEPSAENPELSDGYYTVQRGDTLWKISEKFLGNGDQYMKIVTANNLDPSGALYAGLRLKIPTE